MDKSGYTYILFCGAWMQFCGVLVLVDARVFTLVSIFLHFSLSLHYMTVIECIAMHGSC